MILIGQYDSPFVRRVGIALRLYGVPFEHRPWSSFGDADKIAVFNPLRRVPTLVLDDGQVIIESGAMLDYLDERVGEGRLIAPFGPERRKALYIMALATGLADKCVSLIYELLLHEQVSEVWVARCVDQIGDVLTVLEAERAKLSTPFWFGERIGHADIAVVCALRFAAEAHAGRLDMTRYPRLWQNRQALEAMPVFVEISQSFKPPK